VGAERGGDPVSATARRGAIIEIPDSQGLYATINEPAQSKAAIRNRIDRLGAALAGIVHDRLSGTDRVLCAVILRGGALLYPSFLAELDDADFCMLGLRRVAGEVVCEYRTDLPHDRYDHVLYLDCVAATGSTILTARRAVAQACAIGAETAAVICSATTATGTVVDAGVDIIGFSLAESETGGVVAPDLGRLDAGDLFASTGSTAPAR
jgi:hypothetical protein